MNRAELIALKALRESRRAYTRARPGPAGTPGQPGLPGRDGTPGAPGALMVMPAVAAPPAPDPVGIADVTIEQDDLDVDFVISFTDGTSIRRKAKMPEPKPGKEGKPGAFWVRGGIANVGSGTQQVYVIDQAAAAPTYAGTPLVVFRRTGMTDTYTMEIIAS